jgi:hypothetical protein
MQKLKRGFWQTGDSSENEDSAGNEDDKIKHKEEHVSHRRIML